MNKFISVRAVLSYLLCTRPFPRWEGSGNETSFAGLDGPKHREGHSRTSELSVGIGNDDVFCLHSMRRRAAHSALYDGYLRARDD